MTQSKFFHPVKDSRHYLISNEVYAAGITIHFAILVFAWLLDVYLLAYFNIISVFIFSLSAVLNKKGFMTLAYVLAMIEIPMHAGIASYSVGLESLFLMYCIVVALLVPGSTRLNSTYRMLLMAWAVLIFLGMYLYLFKNEPLYTVSNYLKWAIGIINILFIMLFQAYVVSKYNQISDELTNQLRVASEVDCLTKIYNRNFLNEFLNVEVKRQLTHIKFDSSELKNTAFCIAILDLDNFKTINDSYGHLAGDEVLKTTAQLIQENVFSRDLVCRFGGEEFVILFIGSSKENAITVCETIRSKIADHRFVFNGQPITKPITISIGLAGFEEAYKISDNNLEQALLSLADRRLYQAKSNGKNQVAHS